MLPRIRPRVRQAVIIATGLLSLYYFVFGALPSPTLPVPLERNLKPFAFNDRDQDVDADFSRILVKLLTENKPPVTALTKIGSAGVISFTEHRNTTLKRPDLVPVGTSEVKLMRKAHESLLDQIANTSLPCTSGTRGIVSTASGSHLPVFIISLRMLRRTGSILPVELFLRSDEDHGQFLCEDLLPSLNAKCVILDDFLKPTKRGGSLKLTKYQYKVFSILFSSFEDILLLDADNFPVKDPSHAFDMDPFISAGLVTWPDFWISTASEKFYAIQDTEVPPTNLRASTESGQLMVSKRTHSAALLAAAYYNYWGPTHFYPLLTQGGPGEGDKETFVAGASAVGASFYQVVAPVSILGYTEHGEEHGVAMLQHDPVEDFQGVPNPGPFTIHANFPKMDPNTLFGPESPVIDAYTGKHHRLWSSEAWAVKTFGKDVERALWGEIHHVACNLGGVFNHWKVEQATSSSIGTCKKIEDHMDLVFPWVQGDM